METRKDGPNGLLSDDEISVSFGRTCEVFLLKDEKEIEKYLYALIDNTNEAIGPVEKKDFLVVLEKIRRVDSLVSFHLFLRSSYSDGKFSEINLNNIFEKYQSHLSDMKNTKIPPIKASPAAIDLGREGSIREIPKWQPKKENLAAESFKIGLYVFAAVFVVLLIAVAATGVGGLIELGIGGGALAAGAASSAIVAGIAGVVGGLLRAVQGWLMDSKKEPIKILPPEQYNMRHIILPPTKHSGRRAQGAVVEASKEHVNNNAPQQINSGVTNSNPKEGTIREKPPEPPTPRSPSRNRH